ncbi:MAG: DNA translocase FtsK, partial [Bacteroidales bacterium]|nr:DNA translocase FtsK [Bacteroidales bacterium]
MVILILVTGLIYLVFLFRITPEKIRTKRDRTSVSEFFDENEQAEPPAPDNSFSKQIDETDQVTVEFDPDQKESSEEVAVGPSQGPQMTVTHAKEDTKGDASNTPAAPVFKDYDPTRDLSNYRFPGISLLKDHTKGHPKVSDEELIGNKNRIVETLANYNIRIEKIKATIGPTITLYEIIPAPGVRISKIKNLEDDIALSLSALGIRIIAPIPGRGTIGIEVPNRKPEIVSMSTVLSSKRFQENHYELPVALGKTISNETYTFDLARLPHLLVAGATGQGKSVGINAIITSLLLTRHPAHIKFVMIDPKKVELPLYTKIEKHYLAKLPDYDDPIITDNQHVIQVLHSLSTEMDRRYNLLKRAGVRNIKEYNDKFVKRRLNPANGHRFLPYLILVIDEFADLIMTSGKEIELPLTRIAQLARAVGIHMLIATQRPSTNIITGTIKANFPARIAFRVPSMVDSRTILDSPGANHLVGRGDMLVSMDGNLVRVQCAFIDTQEVETVTQFISNQTGYPQVWELPEPKVDTSDEPANLAMDKTDDLFEEAARLVVTTQQGSTSSIQRKFSIGYNR